MERKALHRLLMLTVLVMALVSLNAHPAVATDRDDDKDDDHKPRIASIQSRPEGQTYGRWAAEWWQWAFGIPAAVNPVTDTTGENCAQRQVDEVWFLAGSFSDVPVIRTCEIPGKSLFFPLINNFYGAFLNDPPETRPRSSCGRPGAARNRRRSQWRSMALKSVSQLGSLRVPPAASRRSSTCSFPRVVM
jgi:hypothetical protein